MSTQNANAVAITGGTIANIASSGTLEHIGRVVHITSNVGNDHALTLLPSGIGYALVAQGPKNGVLIQTGAVSADFPLIVRNAATDIHAMLISGDQIVRLPHRLVIPIGADKWAT